MCNSEVQSVFTKACSGTETEVQHHVSVAYDIRNYSFLRLQSKTHRGR